MLQPNSAPQPENSQYPLVPVQQQISAEYHLKLGKNLYQSYMARSRQQDLNAAIRHFQKAVEIEPNLAEGYIQLAGALWEQGAINLELAQYYCETAIRLDPSQAAANLYLGYFLQRAGMLDDAIQQYRVAIRKNFLSSARARIALGNALLKNALDQSSKPKQVLNALSGMGHFALGLSLIPLDEQTFGLLREAMMTDAQIYTLGTMAKIAKKVGLSGVTRGLYRFGARLLPKETMFHHLLGDECLFDLKRPEEAIRHYKTALTQEPQNMPLLKKLGNAYAQARDTENASATLEELIAANAEDFDSLYQMAQLYIDEKYYFKALYYLKECEKRCPTNPYVHSNIAYVLFKMKDLEGAYEEYKVALQYGTDPVWLSTVSQTLGTLCYQVRQDLEESQEFLEQSLHYNPENQEAVALLADIYFESGQAEMALSAYKTLLQMNPRNAACYSNIGYILWQMDLNEAAIDAYLSSLELDPDNEIAYNNLGVIFLDDESEPAKALALFRKAFSLNPAYTLACFNAGRALEMMGRTLEAAEQYNLALKLNQARPELEDAEIQSRLDDLFR